MTSPVGRSRVRSIIGRRDARHDIALIVGLLALGVLLPIVVSAIAGSLEIPRNDDWSYRRIALETARTGRLTLDGASQTMIVGQILLAQPILWLSGLQPWAFAAAGIGFAVGAMVSGYAMARQLLPARLAVIPVVLLAIFPGYLAYATSFMSDVPALAAEFFCLALGAMALRRRPVSTKWLLASVAVGFFGFSIREFAVAAPAAVALAAICAEPRRRRSWVIAVVTAAAYAGLYTWRSTLSGQLGDVPPTPLTQANILLAISNVALVMLPAAILAAARWHRYWRRSDVLIGLEIGLLIIALRVVEWAATGRMPPILIGNIASPWGVPHYAYLLGGRPLLFPEAVWIAINLLALAGTVATLSVGAGIAGAHLRHRLPNRRDATGRLGSPSGVLFLFCVTVAGGLSIYAFRHNIFDRYLWPLVPALATLFLYVPETLLASAKDAGSPGPRWQYSVSATLAGCVLAAMSLMYLLNSHAFDAARWRAGQALADIGVPADQIDAGYEWMGYHATTMGYPGRHPFYRGWWPAFEPCGIVTADPTLVEHGRRTGMTTYDLYLVAGPTTIIYLYRVIGPECTSVFG